MARPEDSVADVTTPGSFYAATTGGFIAQSHLWRLTLTDLADPALELPVVTGAGRLLYGRMHPSKVRERHRRDVYLHLLSAFQMHEPDQVASWVRELGDDVERLGYEPALERLRDKLLPVLAATETIEEWLTGGRRRRSEP